MRICTLTAAAVLLFCGFALATPQDQPLPAQAESEAKTVESTVDGKGAPDAALKKDADASDTEEVAKEAAKDDKSTGDKNKSPDDDKTEQATPDSPEGIVADGDKKADEGKKDTTKTDAEQPKGDKPKSSEVTDTKDEGKKPENFVEVPDGEGDGTAGDLIDAVEPVDDDVPFFNWKTVTGVGLGAGALVSHFVHSGPAYDKAADAQDQPDDIFDPLKADAVSAQWVTRVLVISSIGFTAWGLIDYATSGGEPPKETAGLSVGPLVVTYTW